MISDCTKYTEYIDKALSTFNLNNDIVCYRGVCKEEFNTLLKDSCLKGFTSMSVNHNVAKAFVERNKDGKLVVFKIKKGTDGAYIGDNSTYPEEQEFLLSRNARFTSKIVNNILEVEID